ncbi:uncharacterized protein LOC111355096 [Spodoptera litura]|uniref:Uncharacterized protein LOC111355096 n=1 Tax=Spodoptera litura TaxID=69820 RepID=A0A9J7EBJ2_SPOLT|nr:uncharacterized protein LOC111355096 [Spodoptera litura]
MATSSRAARLVKALDNLVTKTCFDYGTVLKKVKLTTVSNGAFQGTFTVDKSMCNMGGSLHGGYIAAVSDVLSFYTQLSNDDAKLSFTTGMNINYIGVAFEGDTVNVATKSLKKGNSSVVETYFHNEKGKILAKSITSFLVGPEPLQTITKDVIGFDVYEN